MTIHQRRHPVYVEGCDACRWSSVALSADATPTRRERTAEVNATERRWNRDGDAYRRIRATGDQPAHIDGCADLERYAEHKYDLAMMQPTGWKQDDIKRAEQVMDDWGMPHI